MMKRFLIGLAGIFLLAGQVNATAIIDNGTFDQVYGILSDFSQSYGQVNGDDFVISEPLTITDIQFWGLYYNYSDFTNNPPTQDDFTLRIHEFSDGAPEEDGFLEVYIGEASSRVDSTLDLDCCPLDIYTYTFTGLSISLDPGHYLLSIINETPNPTDDGYWHWVSSDYSGSSFWRRENALNITGQDQDFYDTFYWTESTYEYAFNITTVPEPATISLDIKPGSCPNPLNTKSKGVLPIAILGTQGFDVNEIDPTSVRLEGIAPIRSSIEDVATPEYNDECNDYGPDGFDDLTLKFKTQEIVNALGELNDGDVLTLELTGDLIDGTPIEGEDIILIKKKGGK